jgi:hypothetical protein
LGTGPDAATVFFVLAAFAVETEVVVVEDGVVVEVVVEAGLVELVEFEAATPNDDFDEPSARPKPALAPPKRAAAPPAAPAVTINLRRVES